MNQLLALALTTTLAISCGNDSQKKDEKRERQARDRADASAELVVIGDSLANGVFASTHLGEDPARLLDDISGVFGKVVMGEIDLHSEEMRKEGRDTARSAFMSNTSDWSVPRQIAATFGRSSIQTVDFVLNGAQASSAFREVADYPRTNPETTRFFVLNRIGNDYCNEKSVETFKAQYDEVVGSLLENFEMEQLIVFNLAPVQILRNGQFEETFSFKDLRLNISSADGMRRKYCKSLYAEGYLERAAAMNAAVDEIVAKHAAKHDNLHLIRLDTMDIVRDDVAIDGFHLSESGQKKMAKAFGEQWKGYTLPE